MTLSWNNNERSIPTPVKEVPSKRAPVRIVRPLLANPSSSYCWITGCVAAASFASKGMAAATAIAAISMIFEKLRTHYFLFLNLNFQIS